MRLSTLSGRSGSVISLKNARMLLLFSLSLAPSYPRSFDFHLISISLHFSFQNYPITISQCFPLCRSSFPCLDYFRSFDSMNLALCSLANYRGFYLNLLLGIAFLFFSEFGMERESREVGIGASAVL